MVLALGAFRLGSSEAAETISATVRMEEPQRHFFQVEIVFPRSLKSPREIKMAAWIPGSYRIRDFARNVEHFEALDTADNPLEWHKADKSTWVIRTEPSDGFKVRYQVFSDQYSIRYSFLDPFFGFINASSLFFYEPSRMSDAYRVRLIPARGWNVATTLPGDGKNAFLSSNWDGLVDSPLLFGPLRKHEFEVAGIPHEWVIAGQLDMNEPEMADAIRVTCEAVGEIFGGFPFQRYQFQTMARVGGRGGGLEHFNSTMLQVESQGYRSKDGWDRFLKLVIHEYFHAWNVKAIHDRSLGPFDYQNENYTDLLWLHEGWTDYYDTILMRRVEFWDGDELKKSLAGMVDTHIRHPGTDEQSLRDASFNTWIHYYQPTATWQNSRTSYYSSGAVSALALDLLIRHETGDRRSLDDVMRALYQDHAAEGRAVDYQVVVDVTSDVLGRDASSWFSDHIAGTTAFDWETLFGHAGLTMVYADEDESEDDESEGDEEEEPKPYEANAKVSMDITVRDRDGAVVVRRVLRDGRAWKAGLAVGDEILAVDDRRVDTDTFEKALGWYLPEDEIELLIARQSKIIRVSVTLTAAPQKLTLVKMDETDERQEAIFSSLFGEEEDGDGGEEEEKD